MDNWLELESVPLMIAAVVAADAVAVVVVAMAAVAAVVDTR